MRGVKAQSNRHKFSHLDYNARIMMPKIVFIIVVICNFNSFLQTREPSENPSFVVDYSP